MYPANGRYIPYQSSRVSFHTWGTGPRLVFAFHGYGESGAAFGCIGSELDAGQTLVAIDLPFHGLTEWKEGLTFYPEQLFAIMQEIACSVGEGGPGDSGARGPGSGATWGLFGYSMGGRIALRLFQDHPDCFDRLVLAAPDGMTINPWYSLATATAAGNRLFRWSMRRPGLLYLLLRGCHAVRLLNMSIYKFAIHYIDDRAVRQELYTRWTAMRKFKPDLSRIAAIVRNRQVPVDLVYGKFDRIIRWERGEKFRRRGLASCRVILADAGHQLLRPQYLSVLLPLLRSPS
jgi:pimeloyl-ACP methyl ester carboxylesterase